MLIRRPRCQCTTSVRVSNAQDSVVSTVLCTSCWPRRSSTNNPPDTTATVNQSTPAASNSKNICPIVSSAGSSRTIPRVLWLRKRWVCTESRAPCSEVRVSTPKASNELTICARRPPSSPAKGWPVGGAKALTSTARAEKGNVAMITICNGLTSRLTTVIMPMTKNMREDIL